jgi:hypothetical protein
VAAVDPHALKIRAATMGSPRRGRTGLIAPPDGKQQRSLGLILARIVRDGFVGQAEDRLRRSSCSTSPQ